MSGHIKKQKKKNNNNKTKHKRWCCWWESGASVVVLFKVVESTAATSPSRRLYTGTVFGGGGGGGGGGSSSSRGGVVAVGPIAAPQIVRVSLWRGVFSVQRRRSHRRHHRVRWHSCCPWRISWWTAPYSSSAQGIWYWTGAKQKNWISVNDISSFQVFFEILDSLIPIPVSLFQLNYSASDSHCQVKFADVK